MKQILTWNEEYLDLNVVMVIPDENAEQRFRDYVTERAAFLLGIAPEDAARMLGEDDEKNWEEQPLHYFTGNASIDYGDYCEWLSLEDVPVLAGELELSEAAEPLLAYLDEMLAAAPEEYADISDEENEVYADMQNLKESLQRYIVSQKEEKQC